MAIWKLEPTEVSSPDWEASTYMKKVFVRAESEKKARDIVCGSFPSCDKSKIWK